MVVDSRVTTSQPSRKRFTERHFDRDDKPPRRWRRLFAVGAVILLISLATLLSLAGSSGHVNLGETHTVISPPLLMGQRHQHDSHVQARDTIC